MNPIKTQDLFHHHPHHHHHLLLHHPHHQNPFMEQQQNLPIPPPQPPLPDHHQNPFMEQQQNLPIPPPQPPLPDHHQQQQSPFSFPADIIVYRDDEDEEDEEEKPVDSPSPSSSDADDSRHQLPATATTITTTTTTITPPALQNSSYIDPEPHISSQFYTFNRDSHALMVRCIIERRLATPDEIRRATPFPVLKSWRSVWKDRNEDTAYLTAWKRIQDKLNAHIDPHGNQVLYFKNNSNQYVSYIDQWYDIVSSFHGDADLKHLGLKETVDRIKQVWTVGAKFYGIPESFIRACVSSCLICSDPSGSTGRSKRRRFEYTESFDVPAKEVQQQLQQLAVKHKVVLCIRQKYIRYKPFMAEVKDYACHRAGEPVAKKSKLLKREPYASKRCGCGFRIRAIVPIANYSEKEKTFVYQEEGTAVFKLYAVHSGHEPGPLDGNARIIHRVVGHKGGGFMMDQETVYGMTEDTDFGDLHLSVLQQVQDLKVEAGLLEGRVGKVPQELLGALSRELFDIVSRLRTIGEDSCTTMDLLQSKQHPDDVLVGESDLEQWGDHHHDQIYGNGKDTNLIDEDDDTFGQALEHVVPWDRMRTECTTRKVMMTDNCKPDKWLKDACSEFDAKNILECEEDSKLIKPLRHDETIVTDAGLVGIQVDGFYPENSKWYDSPCGLDPSSECGDSGFRHGEIV